MIRRCRLFSLTLALVFLPLFAAETGRVRVTGKVNPSVIQKQHPVELLLSGKPMAKDRGSRGGNRLVILLCEFQEDTDPRSTGNGRFLTQADTSWAIPFGAPPHDRAYFEDMAEAMRYYYAAASQGIFMLEASVYPRTGYYQLPREMSYYNPPGASSSAMVQRFEEYFRDVLLTADADPDFQFSEFDHYMVVHAGSDWQHDTKGDTPADIPSFFIQVGTGKEVTVDDGTKVISHLCNVPEYLTQDITVTDNGSQTIVDGYGVTNSVMVHEFGHSLGFVDLYNTYNFRPAVGYWDIMDNGGFTELNFEYPADSGLVYPVEGGIPGLPGAFSRMIAWEDGLRSQGLFRDIADMDLTQPINIVAAGKILEAGDYRPNMTQILKIPLNTYEYLLVENRQVDADKDGPTFIATDSSTNPRVILYPAGWDDPDETPDEYDYALPAWIGTDANSFGGGLIIWHVDEKKLFHEGEYQNGEFVSNFDRNAVNLYSKDRGVSVVEADGLWDIGNPYSLYWTGTSYEPWFRYKPDLDDNGLFTGWSTERFTDRFDASTKPAMVAKDGTPGIWSIRNIDSEHYRRPFQIPPDFITFDVGMGLFEKVHDFPDFMLEEAIVFGKPGIPPDFQMNTLAEYPVLPYMTLDISKDFDSMLTIRHMIDQDGTETWADPFGTIYIPQYDGSGIATGDVDGDGFDEYVYCGDRNLNIVRNRQVVETISPVGNLASLPVFPKSGNRSVMVYGTEHELYFREGTRLDSLPIATANVRASGGDLWVTGADGITRKIDPFVTPPVTELNQAGTGTLFFADTLDSRNNAFFTMDPTRGLLIRNRDGAETVIFDLAPYVTIVDSGYPGIPWTNMPTHLAIGDFVGDGRVYLVFGAGNMVFAITTEGTLAPGFPLVMEGFTFSNTDYPRILRIGGHAHAYFRSGDRLIAIRSDGKLVPEHTLMASATGTEDSDLFHWNNLTSRLTFLVSQRKQSVLNYSSVFYPVVYESGTLAENPIVWNGFSDTRHGLYRGAITPETPASGMLNAYAFPNPVKKGRARFRVEGGTADIEVKIYDLAGNLVCKQTVDREPGSYQDNIFWDTSDVASGVYFALVKSGGETKRIKVAVEN